MTLEFLHSLLKRQLKQCFTGAGPPESLAPLLEAINEAYKGFDADRAMLERALELSSAELLQASSEMRSVLRAFPDLFFRIDLEGRILDCRGGEPGDFLLPAETLIGKRLQDLPALEASRRIEEAIASVRRTRKPANIEYSLPLRGRPTHYEARFVPLLDREIFGIVRNITERRLVEERIERTLGLLKATLDSTADAILVTSLKRRVLVHNQKFVDLWGIPQELLAEGDSDKVVSWVQGLLKEPGEFLAGVGRLYEHPDRQAFDTLEVKDGRTIERYSQPYRQGGAVAGLALSFRDVTERRRLEGVLMQSEKMSAVGQLAAGVAHEINNPLGVILGFSQTLTRLIRGDGDPLALPIRSIEREALRCRTLVQQLLTFSRSRPPGMLPEDLAEVVDGALPLVTTQAKVRSVVVEREFGEGLPRAMVDRSQIQQVVINLCSNAMDAMPQGGRLGVRIAARAGAPGEAACIELSISDTGTGIPPEIRSRIFDPFFTTKEVGKGTGLGLALVHEIVCKHHGRIEVNSIVGSGTTFLIYLPTETPPEAAGQINR